MRNSPLQIVPTLDATMKRRFFSYLLFVASMGVTCAGDWPGWRGPQAHGVSIEQNLPIHWGPQSNIVWRAEVPGKGASSPVVVGRRLYLTTQMPDTSLHVIAYDPIEGNLLWDKEVGSGTAKTHELINMATPTTAADDQHVWALFGTGLLACLDRDGHSVWSRDLSKVHGDFDTLWGMGTSPILHDGKLFLAIMQQGPSYVLAINAASGIDLWKTSREHGATKENRDSYSSPTLATVDGHTQVIVSGGDHLDAYDPDTGDRLWVSGGLSVPHPYGRTIASPTAAGDFILTVASGYQNRGHLMAMRAHGKGEDVLDQRLWIKSRYSPDCPSPVIYYGYAFTLRDDGIAQCIDLRSGEAYWQERLFAENSKVSPVAGDGRIYFMSGRGNCVVVKADKEFKVIARNELNEDTLAAMAVANGRFFLRTTKALYAIKE
ncbi:PQQ-binding-like beta-propeller repeat protein [bacterium]|nr:PQQ-binding-like beta-propeller repeat protein [bacterium]